MASSKPSKIEVPEEEDEALAWMLVAAPPAKLATDVAEKVGIVQKATQRVY